MISFAQIKRHIVDQLFGAEKRAFVAKLSRIEALQTSLESRQVEMGALHSASSTKIEQIAEAVQTLQASLQVRHVAMEASHTATTSRLDQIAAASIEPNQELQVPLSDCTSTNGEAKLAPILRSIKAGQTLSSQLARIPDLDLTTPSRSVLFLHNSYYHFFYLARALRKRGWRAISVSLEDPNGPHSQYYHGQDVCLHDADAEQMHANICALYGFAKAHFQMMHFAGDGAMSFFPGNFQADEPSDIVEWKRLGKKLAYTISGCNSATSQSSVHRWATAASGTSLCDNCVWQLRPDVCSDVKNLAWGKKVHTYCDAVFTELQPSLDFLSADHRNVIRGPHTLAVDEDFWSPQLVVPEAFRLERKPGEVLVYHAFGNYDFRGRGDRNIKGTPAIAAAVQRLRDEGLPVRMIFFSRVPNELVRYYQAQADIVVDQLWAGSWGANGREAMMLGKPVVGYVNAFEFEPQNLLEAIRTTPIVNASVDTIYEVLRDLVLSPEKRRTLGVASRNFAVKWHGAAACAQTYELAYDAILARGIEAEEGTYEQRLREPDSDFPA